MRLRRLLGRGGDEPGADEATDDDLEAAGVVADVEVEVEEPDAVAVEVDEVLPAEEPGDADDAEVADEDSDDEDDEAEEAEADEGEIDPDGQIAFELADWGSRERKMIDEQLGALRVPRAWEASTLVVAAADGEVVDDLIDEIEERLALDLAPDVEPVTYDVGDWPEGLEDRFIEALIEARIPHERGYRAVTIGIDDEERVDTLVEEVSKAWEDEQVPEDELDGPDAQAVLSELFVSADRLLHDPSDRPGTVRFDDAASSIETMGLPFGFAAADWEAVTTRVAALRDLLSEAETTDEQIVEAATDLRTQLRPLV